MTHAAGRRPSVFVADEQDAERVDVTRWMELAESVLEAQGVPRRGELSVLFVDEAEMAALNDRHMGSTGPTDVLAFPLEDEGLEAGRWPDNGTSGPDRPGPEDDDDMPLLLGDVVVCPAVAARQAPEHAGGPHHGGTTDDEIALLIVHGILHILGMDHAEPEETEAMQARERELLERFHPRS